MKSATLAVYLVVLAAGAAMAGIYAMFSGGEGGILVFKMAAVYSACALIILAYFIVKIYTVTSDLKDKCDDLERLLLDIREGKKNYYREKRKNIRLSADINAQILNSNFSERIRVLNISYDGALLRSGQNIRPGEVLDLKVFLPLFPQPVDIKAKVVRTSAASQEGAESVYYIGVEYADMPSDAADKLIETITILLRNKTKSMDQGR